uniref:Zinc knuckle CX2CX4HX4C domain-containing protein n=1 Tax=Setaria italica TaxID=4555 RepID=K3YC31_SETIT
RFLAVGFLLSTLLVNSRNLFDHMKKVWKLCGEMDKSPVKAEVGKKFILEFLVEGDWKHIIMGGPWQYKGDAFLVEGITSGIDPSAALFTDVLMWKLAHDLGESLGTTMMIDSSARGPINNKFLRTRVQLPLFTALQKEIVLVDDITGEEFVVQVRYERLPNFCLFCGYIRHVEDICDLPAGERKINFSLDLHVHPVHFDDPRCWNLPDCMGQPHQSSSSMLWRAPKPTTLGLPDPLVKLK